MAYLTPTKNPPDVENKFSPITLRQSPAASSQKNLTGSPRVAKDIIADIYNAIQHWNDHHIKGAKIVKEITSLRQDNEKYSTNIEKLILHLEVEVTFLNNYLNLLGIALSQINSLQKLKPTEILFISHTAESIAKIIDDIYKDYEKEIEVKNLVLENIAHSENISECMFYAALWSHQIYIANTTLLNMEVLLVESGHKKN